MMKEMEQMMNTERTRSLLEVSQLKEALSRKKKSFLSQTMKPFPPINETPIKVVDTPIKENVESSTDLTEMMTHLSQNVNELNQV